MTLQLNEQEKNFIKNSILEALPHAKLYVFGSRANGKAKLYSDLDLLIVGQEKIPLVILSHLEEIFAESDLVFKIDLVDWHRISDEFRNKIKTEWVEL